MASTPNPDARRPLRGLYAVTSAAMCADSTRLLASSEAALCGGARLLEYRDKQNERAVQQRLAPVLANLCRHFGATLIIDHDLDLALACGAGGVHLGSGDASVADARRALGPQAIIGATAGTDLELAQAAQAAGADYVSFGRFFASRTKPNAPVAPLELLVQARTVLQVSICAIGGVRLDNGAGLIAAGADLLGSVEGVFDHGDAAGVERTARAYVNLFTPDSQAIPPTALS
ncbi:MAG TPA: thiamine phosphate synthase [Nevskiaceae bacterium]|nr:thiamine phosphate synthase [Nevskiaceae bacterium]